MNRKGPLAAFKNGAAQRAQQQQQHQKQQHQTKSKKPNPFETKVNKTKFSILNRNIAGSSGKPTQAKARSIQKRTKTILPELQRRGRTGDFVDRRFGERNVTLSTDEKMLERFSRERLRSKKGKSIFNLNDGENTQETDYSHTLSLTHRGRNIDDLDAFDSDPEAMDDDDDNEGFLDAETVSQGHFGDGDTANTSRSKAEIMQEVIAKSKKHKIERQQQREENEALCDTLDADFHSILTKGALPATRPPRELQQQRSKDKERDEYDEAIKAMAFDKRSQPTDRTKTVEELKADASKKSKEFLDAKRKRMQGDDLDDEVKEMEGEDRSSDDVEETDAEKSIKKVMEQVISHMKVIRTSKSLKSVNEAFSHVAALSRSNSVIPVARVIREELGEVVTRISSLAGKGKQPTMPNHETLMLFHLIGCIFSTSDYHHIVVTPATLLISSFLEQGRLLHREHLLSSLFLIQTIFSYTTESKRISPEAFSLLYAIAHKVFDSANGGMNDWIPYSKDRLMSRSLHELLTLTDTKPTKPVVRPISFADLRSAETMDKGAISGFILYLIRLAITQYQENAAAPELFGPFLSLIKGASIPTDYEISELETIIRNIQQTRKPLQLQKQRAVPISSLVPDIDDGGSTTREERELRILQRTYKRELKGAKRELKRDSAFLAQQKLQIRLEADRKYNDRIRQIVGSIANESAADPSQSKRRRK